MIREIDTVGQEQEGLCYDLGHAQDAGLYEQLTVKFLTHDGDLHEVQISDELFEALMRQFDLSVNVGPSTEQNFIILGKYVYDYGDAERFENSRV